MNDQETSIATTGRRASGVGPDVARGGKEGEPVTLAPLRRPNYTAAQGLLAVDDRSARGGAIPPHSLGAAALSMDHRTDHERRRIVYTGRVQGVGFRATAYQVSRGFAVVGYVRNQDDGSVELVVEGNAAEVSRFLAAVDHALRGFIRQAHTTVSPATGQFDTFEIQV